MAAGLGVVVGFYPVKAAVLLKMNYSWNPEQALGKSLSFLPLPAVLHGLSLASFCASASFQNSNLDFFKYCA